MKKLLTLLLLSIVISYSAIAQLYLLHGKSLYQVKIELKNEGITESDFNTGAVELEDANGLYYLTFYHEKNEAEITYLFVEGTCTSVIVARDYSLLNETIAALNRNSVKQGDYWYNYRQFYTYKYEVVRQETYFYMLITVAEIH